MSGDHKVDIDKIKEGAKELTKLIKKGAKKVGSACKKTWKKVKMLNKTHKIDKKISKKLEKI